MREGSLEAPTRHALDWQNPDFLDPAKIDEELRRVFDICHGCRRCFNLCDSFPKLFDLIDAAPSGELHDVASQDFKPVVDACTLCDLCFMTKCPYVPPHEFNLDFPHLMLRYRAMENAQGVHKFADHQLRETDRNGKMAGLAAPIANWASDVNNKTTRPLMEKFAGIDQKAALPKFQGKSLLKQAKANPVATNTAAPAAGKRKAVIYATCFGNYNNPDVGLAAIQVLAKNGVELELAYPACCGMPKLELGDLPAVAEQARKVSSNLLPYVQAGYDVIALVPSCALMMKFEWPLILPDDENIKKLANATFDLSEYVVDIAKKHGMAEGLQPLDGGMTLHLSCHARAQNMGQKATEMVKLIPNADVAVIERCSGHGGAWGVMKENFETAMKIGKPVAKKAVQNNKKYLASECPLAGLHIAQGVEREKPAEQTAPELVSHPIQFLAKSYGF